MATETERKFLVDPVLWQAAQKGRGVLYRQGYLLAEPAKTVRVRLTETSGYLTIKGPASGASRPEYEYVIPKQDAAELLEGMCTSVIAKLRYAIVVSGKHWDVDAFLDANAGLLLAEIELASEEEPFDLPPWALKEVTGDIRYYNAYLAQHPFQGWPKVPH